MSDTAGAPARGGWLARLKAGLSRTSENLTIGIAALFTDRKLDNATLEDLEDLLITADLGIGIASRLTTDLGREKFDRKVTDLEIRETFAATIADVLEPVARPLDIDPSHKPHVILVCGVNGSGKTTTIGKLARQWTNEGKTVWLAAGDTFRAAAIEQLQVWGERTGVPVIARPQGTDPAALAFDAVSQAREAGADVLMIDTAGRLQNRAELMDELAKVVRVIAKQIPGSPHDCLLVLDGTVGQNAHSQVRVFRDMVAITGLVITKLDGSARGGIVVGLADTFGLPVHAIGVGEQAEDLRPFEARSFGRSLMGLD